MKTISIGRGESCNIIVDDEMMSRSHAIIRIPTFGKMEVVDMSKNGTYVNGVRVRPNVPVPVTRKDVVNFAEVYQLDWSTIPDPLKYYKIGAIIVGGLIVLIFAIWLVKSLVGGSNEPVPQPATEQVQKPVTTIEQQAESTIEEPAQEQTEGEAESQNPTATDGQETQSEDFDPVKELNKFRVNKARREAEERARQQKAKAQQKAKEQQQSKPQESQPSKDKSSDGNKNKTVVI